MRMRRMMSNKSIFRTLNSIFSYSVSSTDFKTTKKRNAEEDDSKWIWFHLKSDEPVEFWNNYKCVSFNPAKNKQP